MTNQIFIVGKRFEVSEHLRAYIMDRVIGLELDFEPLVCYCHVDLQAGDPLREVGVVVHCHGHVLKASKKAPNFYSAIDGAVERMAGLLKRAREAEDRPGSKFAPEFSGTPGGGPAILN